MDSSSTPAWRVGGTSPPAVDITVPYADENRNHLLLGEWRRQAGASLPAPPLLLPRRDEGEYRVRIQAQQLLDIPIEDQYSDAIAGSTGGPGGHLEDKFVTHVTLSGQWRFMTGNQRVTAAAGTLAVRRNEQPWDFEVDRGTRALAVGLPASALRLPPATAAVTVDQASPPARMLLAQLRLFAEVYDDLGPAAATAAGKATVELFQALVNDQVIDDARVAPALFRAAVSYVEDRLLDDPDLSPRDIALALHVSVRTLYRAFAQHGTSVMGYVRQRRLERARAEIVSARLTVSDAAARWHFADSSHFVKVYKKRFGETPSAGRRS